VPAGGLNFADFMTAKGGYPGTPAPPLVAGREFAGVEESTGRRVMGYAQWAAFAEKTAASPNMLWPTPTHWTDEQAAAFPVNYFTAYLAYWQSGLTPSPAPDAGAPSLSRSVRKGGDFDSASGTKEDPGVGSNPGAPSLSRSMRQGGDFDSASGTKENQGVGSNPGAPSLSRSGRQGGDFDSASGTKEDPGAPFLADFARKPALSLPKGGVFDSPRTPRVLIQAVAGGVGTAAVQIGQLLGVEMYGISSSEEKLSKVKALGLHHPINYKKHDYEEVVKNLTHGEGVDSVFEMLGGEHTAKSLRCLRDFGRVIQYGTATGRPPQLDLRAMYAKSAAVQGLWLTYLSQKPEIMQPAWQQLSTWIEQKKLTPQIGHVFPLDQGKEAYKLLEAGQNYGKIILKIA
jgi:NADPH:quinone reductase-like Zn-dependent oxidoreductase